MYKLNKGLTLSIIFHLFLLTMLARQPLQKMLPTISEKGKVKPIQARLYFPPQKKQSTVIAPPPILSRTENKRVTDQSKPIEELSSTKLPPKVQAIRKIEVAPETSPTPHQLTQKVLTSQTSNKTIAQSALDKLQSRLKTQALESSQNDSFKQYLKDKNTIERSITKLYEVPEAKAKRINVECNGSVFNTTLTVISGFMGGSIRCNPKYDLKKFLRERAEEKTGKKREKR